MSKAKDRGTAVPEDVNPSEIEDALCRIGGVSAARIVMGPGERIVEVHILAGTERSPKQVVRDVQSVALTTFGIEIDYRTVSVVQLEGTGTSPAPDPPPEEPADEGDGGARWTAAADVVSSDEAAAMQPTTNGSGAVARQPEQRPALIKVGSEVAGHATVVTVAVRVAGRELTGSARGPASTGPLLVCRAVTSALGPTMGDAAVDVEVSRFVEVGSNEVAICVLRTATGSGDVTVSGSALVRRDPSDAMARATMAALNRLLSRIPVGHEAEPA